MNEINYIIADIRIGTPGRKTILDHRCEFQDDVVKLFFENCQIKRLAYNHSFSFSHGLNFENRGEIQAVLDEALDLATVPAVQIHALVVDFTWSPALELSDPILMLLAGKLIALFKKKQLNTCIILLPFSQQPDDSTAIVEPFAELKKYAPECQVMILALDGDPVFRGKESTAQSDIKAKYAELLRAHQDDPAEELRSKMVARLGCFARSCHDEPPRIFSYLIDNGDTELRVLLEKWWLEKQPKCDALLFDTENISSMTEAVKAFALNRKLPFERIKDVLKNPQLLINLPVSKRCCVVLDVVDTGGTFKRHKTALEVNGWSIEREVVAAIMKGGGNARPIDGHLISCFLPVEHDPEDVVALQKNLRLPVSSSDSESVERFDQLRSFDIWYMSRKSDWAPETEVPENIGFAYRMVPVFPKMLKLFGDYVAYKMDLVLKTEGLPLDYFIIHPDEPGANSVSTKLRTRLDPNVLIVRVPRDYIKQAQKRGNDWASVIDRIDDKKEEWLFRLRTMERAPNAKRAPAIITDVFNSSGSTFRSLQVLLDYLKIPCFCYFPFIDRDDFNTKPDNYPVKRFCLYSWYGPRKLKKVGTRV